MQPATTSPPRRSLVLALSLLSSLTASGCAGEDHERADEAAALAAAELPAPQIESVSLSGPGCPSQDEISISGARHTFRIDFERFEASLSSSRSAAESECSVRVAITGPDGVAYALAGSRLALSSRSPREAPTAVTIETRSAWNGETPRVRTTSANSQGRTTKPVFEHADAWSPCSGRRELELGLKLRVRGSGGVGLARIDSLSAPRFQATACEPDADAPPRGEPDPGMAAPEGDVIIHQVESGCVLTNPGEVSGPDRKALDARFADFRLGSARPRMECVLRVGITPPPGFRATIASFDVDGSAAVSSEAAFSQLIARYWFTGRSDVLTSRTFDYQGVKRGSFRERLAPSGRELPFGRCGPETLTLSLAAYMVSPEAADTFAIERLHAMRFALEKCP